MTTQATDPTVRTRFAPSPTGLAHIGNARTAVFAWLLARHHGGRFLLRVEDTDRQRLVPESLGVIMETLSWLGLDPDEGPEVGGPVGPYVQSERLAVYREHADRLLADGTAYRCYCTPERLGSVRAEQERAGSPTGYDRRCRTLSPEERAAHEAAGEPHTVRLAAPLDGATELADAIRGTVTYDNRTLQDIVLLKSDGYPVYHFAVVIDDRLMGVSHVIRGEEYLSSGAYDTLLHRCFGWEQPVYVHGATILAPDRTKLAKRHGAVAVLEFREQGIVPEALLNYLALLGAAYSGDRELYSREELIELFDVPRMRAAPAIFDLQKLVWMNGQYINHVLSLEDVTARCRPYLERAGMIGPEAEPERLERVIALVKERLKLLPEVVELTAFFFAEPDPAPEQVAGKKLSREEAHRLLDAALARLRALSVWEGPEIVAALTGAAEEQGVKRGALFMPVRVAVTGSAQTPPIDGTLAALGREPTLARLERAVAVLAAGVDA